MIIFMAYPGRYMRLFYIALVGLLIFDFAFYPLAAHAQSRRTARQAEEKSERSSPRPFTTLVPEESEKEVTPPVEIKSIGKAAYDAVIRSGRYIVGPGDVFAVVVNRGEEIETFEVPVGASGSLFSRLWTCFRCIFIAYRSQPGYPDSYKKTLSSTRYLHRPRAPSHISHQRGWRSTQARSR